MGLTDQQKEAQTTLEGAIEKHRKAFLEMAKTPASEIISDWLLIVACVGYDSDGDQTVAYHFAMPGDQLLDHRAKGLAVHALDLLRFGERIYNRGGEDD